MKYKILILICALIFLIGLIGSVFTLIGSKENTVEIYSDGELIRVVDLSREPDCVFDVEYQGNTNTVEIKDGKIRVKDAGCPDKTCARMGWLSSSAMPIVCLPNRLVIAFSSDNGGVDAVTG